MRLLVNWSYAIEIGDGDTRLIKLINTFWISLNGWHGFNHFVDIEGDTITTKRRKENLWKMKKTEESATESTIEIQRLKRERINRAIGECKGERVGGGAMEEERRKSKYRGWSACSSRKIKSDRFYLFFCTNN